MKRFFCLILTVLVFITAVSCSENAPDPVRVSSPEPSPSAYNPDAISTATNPVTPSGEAAVPDQSPFGQTAPDSGNGTGENGTTANNASPRNDSGTQQTPASSQNGQQTPASSQNGQQTPASSGGAQQTPASSGGGQQTPAVSQNGQQTSVVPVSVTLSSAQIQRRLSDLKNLHLSVENRMRSLYYVVMPQSTATPELRQKETEFLNWSLSDFIDLSGGQLCSDPLASSQSIFSELTRIYNFEFDTGIPYETVTVPVGQESVRIALPVGQTAKYSITVTSPLGSRYEEGTFEDIFLNYDRNGVYKENKKLANPVQPVLSSEYSKIEIRNNQKDKKIIVIHNLEDLSFIAYLAQHFGSVTAINADLQKEGKVVELIKSSSDFDLAICLLDLSREYPALNSGTDIQNGAIKADGTTARPVRIGNGETASVLGKANIPEILANTVTFKKDLENAGIQLLYVSPPYKIIPGYSVLPYGLVDYTNQNRQEYLAGLKQNGIPYIDGAQVLKSRGIPETDWFYNTDHHWRDTSAWYVYQEIIGYLKNTLGWDVDPDRRNTDLNQFQVESYPRYFYGSQAREITLHYAPMDDFTILSPKFDTSFEFTINRSKRTDTKTGTYREVLILQHYLDDPSDTFRNRYAAYIGGDNPNNIIKNLNGYSDKRVLIIEDSFSLPVDCFMSLNFKELQTIDLRSFRQSATSYALEQKFDLVIILQNPSCFYEFPKMYKFK